LYRRVEEEVVKTKGRDDVFFLVASASGAVNDYECRKVQIEIAPRGHAIPNSLDARQLPNTFLTA
jgi:hypothetical protein